MTTETVTAEQTLSKGVEAFRALMTAVRDKADADLGVYWASYPDAEDTDGRDYKALSEIVLADLCAHLNQPDSPQREGYLRALVSVLVYEAEEADCHGGPDWDPIALTARSFASTQIQTGCAS